MRGASDAGRVRRKRADGLGEVLLELFVVAPAWLPVVVAAALWLMAWKLLPGPGGTAGFILAVVVLLIGLQARVTVRRRAALVSRHQTLDALRSMSWREFEELVAEAYRGQGYRAELTTAGADGGADIILRRDGQTTLVQCKRWKQRQVPVGVVRELLGIMHAESAASAVFVTSGEYTAEATAFGRRNGITLVDGQALVELIRPLRRAEVPPPPSPAPSPPTVDVSGATAPTTCPRCGMAMVLRSARYGPFFGCPSYPRCRGTRSVPG